VLVIEAEQNILSDELSIQLDQAESITKDMAKLKVCLLPIIGKFIIFYYRRYCMANLEIVSI
jgi:hypothetical protein